MLFFGLQLLLQMSAIGLKIEETSSIQDSPQLTPGESNPHLTSGVRRLLPDFDSSHTTVDLTHRRQQCRGLTCGCQLQNRL